MYAAYGDYLRELKERISRNDDTMIEVNISYDTTRDNYFEFMRGNTHVKRMRVNGSSIRSLDHLIGNTTLTELYLEECVIDDASAISHLTHLTHLSVSMTPMNITFLSSLVNLTYLDISYTKFKEDVLPSIQHLSKLEVLDISQLRLGDVTAMRSLVSHLLDLSMDYCHLTSGFLESVFVDVESPITKLSVECNNGVSDLKFVRHLRDLDSLQAGECQITDLTPLNQVHVTTVHVHNNPLKNIDCLQYNTTIETLFMMSCGLTNVDSLLKMSSLIGLNILSNNEVSFDIHKTVMCHTRLNKINLPNRRLTLRRLTLISLAS